MGLDTEYEVTETKQPDRLFALITYAIALVCLLAGLFVPLNGAGFSVQAMIALQLPAALNSIVPLDFLQASATNYPLLYSYDLTLGGFTLDIGALLILLYALVTLCGIIALIPAIVNTVKRGGKKNIALNAASFIEICASVVLALVLFFELGDALSDGTVANFTCYALLIAFGGAWLMLALQALRYKKSSGAIKFLLMLISLITVIFALYNVENLFPFMASGLEAIKSEQLGTGLIGDGSAMEYVAEFIAAPLAANPALATLQITVIAVTYLTIANFLLDVMGLGKTTNYFMLVANLVRYALEFVLAIIIIILPFCMDGYTLGLFAIVLAASALISFLINLGRTLSYKKKEAADEDLFDGEENLFADDKSQKPVKVKEKPAPVIPAATAVPEPVKLKTAEPASEPSKGSFYAPMIYYGPTDEFIRSLNNDLKIEFSRVFLERKSNPLTFIPDYVVGGKNDKFFNSVFIYYGRICEFVSDELMNAIYKQANIMS